MTAPLYCSLYKVAPLYWPKFKTTNMYVDFYVQVNGNNIEICGHDAAVQTLKNAGEDVTLTVKYFRPASLFLNRSMCKIHSVHTVYESSCLIIKLLWLVSKAFWIPFRWMCPLDLHPVPRSSCQNFACTWNTCTEYLRYMPLCFLRFFASTRSPYLVYATFLFRQETWARWAK